MIDSHKGGLADRIQFLNSIQRRLTAKSFLVSSFPLGGRAMNGSNSYYSVSFLVALGTLVIGCGPDAEQRTSETSISRQRVETDEFLIRPLQVADAELDYAAVMASAPELRKQFDNQWPPDDFSVAQNRNEIEIHQSQFESGELFTFTIIRTDGSEVLGCVYIAIDKASSKQTILGWLRSDLRENSLRQRIADTVDQWLGAHWQTPKEDRLGLVAQWLAIPQPKREFP